MRCGRSRFGMGIRACCIVVGAEAVGVMSGGVDGAVAAVARLVPLVD